MAFQSFKKKGGRRNRTKNLKKKGNLRKTKKNGGGMFDVFMGVNRIRGQKYEKWLEQRLVSKYNDTEFVNEVRKRFGYDKTNISGRGQLTKQMVDKELCDRSEEERKLISPDLKCSQNGGRKTRKKKGHKKRLKKTFFV